MVSSLYILLPCNTITNGCQAYVGHELDAGARCAHLEKTHGIEAGELKTRYGAEGNGPSLYIEDPDGNRVELKGPPFG